MPPDSKNSVGRLHSSPQSTGVADPDRMTDTQKAELILGKGVDPDDMSDAQIATLSSLNKALTEWTSRALGCADEGVITFSKLSSAQRIRSGATVRTSEGDVKVPADKVGKLLDRERKRLIKAEGARLDQTYGAKTNRNVSLFSKYESVVSALHARAFGAAGDVDVEARQQGLTNLQLFIRHGGKLHSTSKGDKLERTIAKIPANVLKNASANVNIMDYAVAEHIKYKDGRPLLSFGSEFRVTGSWLGQGKESQAYREDLRALTASAHLLGGVGKALKVKELLTSINSVHGREAGFKKEDMVKRVLENLETHCDPDALIDDLEFELTRHDILKGVRESRHNDAKKLYPDIKDKLSKLGADPNRATIIANINYLISAQKKGNQKARGYGFDNPKNLRRDLNFITEKNPIASFMERNAGNAKAARSALGVWGNMMTPYDGEERIKLKSQMDKINVTQFPDDQDQTYLDAVHVFGLIDKNKMDAQSQSELLLSCLSHPDQPPKWHLANMAGGKKSGADPDVNDELKFNDDEDFSESRNFSKDEDFNAGSDAEEKTDIDVSSEMQKFSMSDSAIGGSEDHIVMHYLDDGDPIKKANLDDVEPKYKVVDDLYEADSDNDPLNTGEQKKDV